MLLGVLFYVDAVITASYSLCTLLVKVLCALDVGVVVRVVVFG